MACKYAWQSNHPTRWASDFQFLSYEEAKINALYNALNAHTSKKRPVREVPTSRHIRAQLWRSLRRDGWRIRKQNVPAEDPD